MKILVLGKYYPPYYGGIETLTRNWCEGFVRRGAEVRCIAANDRPRTVRETMGGVHVVRHARFGHPLSTPACPGYLGAARHPADVIQLHFPNPLADLVMLLRSRRTPLVVTYHSDIIRQAGFMRLYQPLFQWLLRRASRVVVATPPQLEHSPWLPAHRHRCAIIPFGLDLQHLRRPAPADDRIRSALAEAGGRPVLLNIGRLVGYKGQRYLVEALRRLDAVAWLVGTGPLRDELGRLAAEVGVADRLRFWGEVEDDLLPALIHACDVFVLSSITPNEAFGLVQVEAMACGKPVVSCQLPSGVPFVNQHGLTGLVVPPADAPALADAVKKLCADPGLRATMGRAGRHRAETEFSLEVMVDRYWKLFGELRSSAR